MNSTKVVFAAAALLCAAHAPAQYPAKAIRIIVPSSAGAAVDLVPRLMSQPLSERLGQQVIVENRAGAGTIIGTEAVARAAPDGYTLLSAPPAFAVNVSLYAKLPYDPLKDFVPVMHTHNAPLVTVVHPSVPVKSVKELIALAKARPADFTYAHSGSGAITHMSMELFLYMSGTRMTPVPYKGPAPALVDVVAGRVPLMMASAPAMLPHLRSGRVRALAVSGRTRIAMVPDAPPLTEAGVPGYESAVWIAWFAPAGTPPEVIARINKEAAAVLQMPALRERFENEALQTVGSSPAELASFVRSEMAKWGNVIKAAGVRPQ
ncbi:MAG TPA: tripartite tricarboxylate transporter substrate binding protein [Burkholderiales bacterium]|nr:tripartite tricarboxylate transporter substrate binding protein [Burkholderiales bacterium]